MGQSRQWPTRTPPNGGPRVRRRKSASPRRDHGVVLSLILALLLAGGISLWWISANRNEGGDLDASTEEGTIFPSEPEPVTPPLSYEGFDPGNIIGDDQFFATDAYDLQQIRGFLDRWNRGCRPGPDGTRCLAEYTEDTPTFGSDQFCPGDFVGRADDTAPEIIWKASQACGINPQVLLTTLQKEQGLITASGTRLNETRYAIAMGYACPDDAHCDPEYFGFATQVYYAARQFRVYEQQPEMFMTAAERSDFIPYAPGEECAGSEVYVENLATSNLYNYTPYQPNPSVFEGAPDACASVGNANFYAYFNAWFGTPDRAAESAQSN